MHAKQRPWHFQPVASRTHLDVLERQKCYRQYTCAEIGNYGGNNGGNNKNIGQQKGSITEGKTRAMVEAREGSRLKEGLDRHLSQYLPY